MRPVYAWDDRARAFAIDRRSVVETIDSPQLVRVPGAPAWLRGVCNRHGRALAVVDCGLLGGLVEGPAAVRQVLVVPVAGAELGIALAAPAREALAPSGDPEGCFDRADDERGTRVIALDRLVRRVTDELGG